MTSKRNSPSDWGAEARGLASRYAVVSGVAVTFVLFSLIIIPAIVRERQAPANPPSDQPAAASVGWLDQAEAPPSKGKDLPPVDPATVMTANPKLLAHGQALFKQNCTSCHGDSGRGDGPAIATLNPKPRNFTQAAGWTRGYRVTDIFATISAGVKGTGMAAYDFILPADRMALVHYVRSLGAFDHGAEDSAASEALANQFRSQGARIPNRIPVSMAIKKMVEEQVAPAPLPLPADGDGSASALLVREVVADPSRAARTVATTKDRTDLAAVTRAWAAGAPGNGFRVALAMLGPDECQQVARILLGLPAVSEKSPSDEVRKP